MIRRKWPRRSEIFSAAARAASETSGSRCSVSRKDGPEVLGDLLLDQWDEPTP
ncbi:hypothetical protein [Streptomyces albiflavescens]|uniref:hypothetical protein n=1 Tax=Streptomyces albiflavescens TaxID=1623582 RepID=UPI00166433BB|nr:hypothetical protein [Streptomyces albiflavescens]